MMISYLRAEQAAATPIFFIGLKRDVGYASLPNNLS